VLVKTVTEILFGNAPVANHGTTVLAADHRPAHYKDIDLDHESAMGRNHTGVGGSIYT